MTTGWYTGSDRQARIRDAIARHGYDVLLAVTPENAHYLAGHGNYVASHWRIPGLFCVAVGPSGQRSVVTGDFGIDLRVDLPYKHVPYTSWTESVDIRQAAGKATAGRIVAARPQRVSRPEQFDLDQVWDCVAKAVLDINDGPSTIGVDLREVDAFSIEQLMERLHGTLLEDATLVFDDLRAIKDPDEIEHLRIACELTELGIEGAVERLRLGMSEAAVNSAYQIAVHEQVIANQRFGAFRQAEGLATIGIGADQPHRVEAGQTIKFDMQVDIAGYHSDVGRTVAYKPTPEQQDVYDALLAALHKAESAIRPGISFAEIHQIGSGAMHEQGFTNYSRGHLGHSVGLSQHFEEPPFNSPFEFRTIAPSMVLSLELPYYIYGVGAFQLERMIEVTEEGAQPIDRLPLALAIDVDGR
jgi:Xaa-Pro aminopeptidase